MIYFLFNILEMRFVGQSLWSAVALVGACVEVQQRNKIYHENKKMALKVSEKIHRCMRTHVGSNTLTITIRAFIEEGVFLRV